MKIRLIFFTSINLLSFFLQANANAQNLLGVILDNKTNKPVSFASVYLPDLNVLSQSDTLGKFNLPKIKNGKYLFQISHLGYEPYLKVVEIVDSIKVYKFYLEETLLELPEVVIVGAQSSPLRKTSFNISSMSYKEMKENGAYSISDAVSRIPGMSQITTGVGISKPVIRGLYGNRIQTNLLGIRFDNQQWQDEHGLGVADMGVDRIEIIKGPASIWYGSEAMGGVLNIIEERPAEVNQSKIDLNTQFFSNTLGNSTNIGWKKSTEKTSFRVRGGFESQGDYSDGDNHRVLNTRFQGYHLKATAGFKSANRSTIFNYMTSYSLFGFVSEDNIHKKLPDDRISRKMDGPFHSVFFNILTMQNTFFRNKSRIKWNIGVHSNSRKENEGGNEISLNMLLNTAASDFQWTFFLNRRWELMIGTQEMFQTNRNYGFRIIVPDANLWEAGVFSYIKYSTSRIITEAGLRVDHKNVSTLKTIINPISDVPILPMTNQYNVVNGVLGTSILLTKDLNLKLNAASGYRAPNLAELASNGLHEGTYRVEIGNPTMKTEQNVNLEATLNFESKDFAFTGAVYNNHIYNYIYLAPTGQIIIYPVYNYIQKTSTIRGGEAQVLYHPKWYQHLEFLSSYSLIQGKTIDDENLPFIPSNRFLGELKYNLKKNRANYVKVGVNYTFKQNHPAQFETVTPDYFLVNAGIGGVIKFMKMPLSFTLSGNNLFNKLYYDHLSRFKYYGIYNIGRNISLAIHLTIK